eukprot:COSAG06_NODE_23877_length_679_cov_0.801724_1_plen_21_part_10
MCRYKTMADLFALGPVESGVQ